jgi:uncharacterized protein (TIGR02145 family)
VKQNSKHIIVSLLAFCVLFANCDNNDNESVMDIDGNTYKIVKIGTQVWMAENLKTTREKDGTQIRLVTDNNEWVNIEDNNTEKAYCYYDNYSGSEYGALYTYAAASNACPMGWHLPSDNEWKTLEMFLGMSPNATDSMGYRGINEGTKLKATSGWGDEGNGTDDFGFAALPGGGRYSKNGDYFDAPYYGYWWTGTESNDVFACIRTMGFNRSNIFRFTQYGYYKSNGFSVRCLKD